MPCDLYTMESATVSTFVTLVNGILSMSTSSKWSIDDLLLLACFHLSLFHDLSSIRRYGSDDTIIIIRGSEEEGDAGGSGTCASLVAQACRTPSQLDDLSSPNACCMQV